MIEEKLPLAKPVRNKDFYDTNKKIPDQFNDPGLFTNQKNLLT